MLFLDLSQGFIRMSLNRSVITSYFIILGLTFCVGLALLFWLQKQSSFNNDQFFRIRIGERVIMVELANTSELRAKGLSGYNNLTPDQGMLFIFPVTSRTSFWMKDMKFPLDFLWIYGGRISQIDRNIPAPTPAVPEPYRISPQKPIDYVLELPAGWAREHEIKIGDVVSGLPPQSSAK